MRASPSLRGARRRSNPERLAQAALDCFGPAGLAMTGCWRGNASVERNADSEGRMKQFAAWLIVALIGASVGGDTFAQQQPTAQQAVQSARYAGALGLPRDGGKLYLPDEAY